MVAGAIAGNISAEATTPTGNTFVEATRGSRNSLLGSGTCKISGDSGNRKELAEFITRVQC
jgi:hypothetical protein